MSKCGKYIEGFTVSAECNREARHAPSLPCAASPDTYDRAHGLKPPLDIEQKAREALAEEYGSVDCAPANALRAALDELAALKADNARLSEYDEFSGRKVAELLLERDAHATDIAVLQTANDILKADLADARRERDEARTKGAAMTAVAFTLRCERGDALRERDVTRISLSATQAGAEQLRQDWLDVTGQRDEWRAKYEVLETERAMCCWQTEKERNEAVRLLRVCESRLQTGVTGLREFLSKFPSAEPAKESEPCHCGEMNCDADPPCKPPARMEQAMTKPLTDVLAEALRFYADPETYHGVAFLMDPPGGGFAEDFADDHDHPAYARPMPGAAARAALARYEAEKAGPKEEQRSAPPRIRELAERMVAPGPAFSRLSASEGHELADWILSSPKADPQPAPFTHKDCYPDDCAWTGFSGDACPAPGSPPKPAPVCPDCGNTRLRRLTPDDTEPCPTCKPTGGGQ